MRKLISLIILLTLVISGCKQSTEPTPPVEQKPAGYQEDVPWPSIADSPWPIYRHDPQNTGRSKYPGPLSGNITDTISAINLEAGLVFGNNNALYFTTSNPGTIHSYLNYDSLLWKLEVGYAVITSPIIDNNGNIYVLSNFNLVKFNVIGEKIWEYEISNGTLSVALTMDKKGNIIFIDGDKNIVSINSSGTLNWNYQESRLMKHPYHAPAFSPDGKVLYLQGETVSLIAFDLISQSVIWTFGTLPLQSAPLVDSQGNIYITPINENQPYLTMYSLDKNANVRWQVNLSGKLPASTSEEMCIDLSGNICLAYRDTLYSFSYDGILNWKKALGEGYAAASPVVDVEGNIYVCVTSWETKKILSFNKTGDILWETIVDDVYILYPPILSDNRKLIVPAFRSKYIYVIN